MAFVKFTKVGKNFTPRVVVHPNGVVSFNTCADERFNLKNFSHTVMYFDPDRQVIGFELVNDEDMDGANPLRRMRQGWIDVDARSFLGHFRLRARETIGCMLRRALDNDAMMLMHLDDVEVLSGRKEEEDDAQEPEKIPEKPAVAVAAKEGVKAAKGSIPVVVPVASATLSAKKSAPVAVTKEEDDDDHEPVAGANGKNGKTGVKGFLGELLYN